MNIKKKVVAIVLTAAMVMSMAASVLAATSPGGGPSTDVKNKGYDVKSNSDNNTQDHGAYKIVRTRILTGKSNIVYQVLSSSKAQNKSQIELSIARNKNNNKVRITRIGNNKVGVFDSARGRIITDVTVSSPAKKVLLCTNAFQNSAVKNLTLTGTQYTFRAGFFNGAKVKNPTIKITGAKKVSMDIRCYKGAFNGLGSKAKIIVSASTMTASEFKKLKARFIKHGFKGSITRE
jgi:hypothetical protein